jgi:hypothetical protein
MIDALAWLFHHGAPWAALMALAIQVWLLVRG